MPQPITTDYATFYQPYIALVKADDVTNIIGKYNAEINNFIATLPNELSNFSYATNKWTIKDVVQHLIDVERVFVYRALRFSRKDNQPLLGFEENDYANNAATNTRTLESLKDEFIALRISSNLFFKSLTEDQLKLVGIANNNSITVNAIIYICFGHLLHHINVLKERYLNK